MGTYVSVPQGAVVEDHEAWNYVEAWRGRVAFDDVAPTVAVSRASASRLRSAYLIRVELFTCDNVRSNPVSFLLSVWSRFLLGAKSGATSTGTASIALRIRPDEVVRRIRLRIEVWDPLGNETALVRLLRLPA